MKTVVFFFNDTATTEIYTLSLHDALPIYENPGLWISKLTNNPDHWAEYGVYDPYTLDAYLDAEAARETRKEYL